MLADSTTCVVRRSGLAAPWRLVLDSRATIGIGTGLHWRHW